MALLSTSAAPARSPRFVALHLLYPVRTPWHHVGALQPLLLPGLRNMHSYVCRPVQEWIPDTVWLNVLALDGMDAFRGLPDAVARGDAAWRAWCGSDSSATRVC